jgi:hypothetical protein
MVINHRRPPTAARQSRRSRICGKGAPVHWKRKTSGFERVFRKLSAIPPTQDPDFHGFPQCRFCVLKIPAFRTEATCYTAVEGEGQDDQKPGQEGLQTGRHLSARFDNRADDHQSAPRTASGRQALRGHPGAKGRKDRPALDALLKSVARREVDMVAAWSVDRLGRSLTDLLDFLRELHAKGVDLFLHPYQERIGVRVSAGDRPLAGAVVIG